MLFEEFILRFVKLSQEIVFVFDVTDNSISFRQNEASLTLVKELEDLLNTLLDERDGKFVVTPGKVITLAFVEAEC